MTATLNQHVFVYGTLAPGQIRWPALEEFADGTPQPDSITGELYDTGCGFPAAVIGAGIDTIPGYTVALNPLYSDLAMQVLDQVEGHPDLFQRGLVVSSSGMSVWAYNWPWSTDEYERIGSWFDAQRA